MIQQEPEEGTTNENEVDAGVIAEEDAVALKRALAEEKEKAESYLANWQRAQADFINYKRRSEQDKEELSKFANSVFMLSLLPVLDDLERAFASIPLNPTEVSWVEGIRLIERKLRASLEAQGLSPIEAAGEPFDPYLHEAVRQDKGKEGIVIEEVQKGYNLHDRVIRPSKVVVGNGEVEETAEAETEINS
ncbi:nucleotide exchange factor GrpE [Chloroflexota bacterium]